MPIDVHAHYVPPHILDVLRSKGRDYGIAVEERAAGTPCLCFDYGLRVRPFFERLLEPEDGRIAAMDRMGIERQVLTLWADIFGYGMPAKQSQSWHRLLNDSLSETCARHPDRFSWFASGALPDAAAAARELERCVRELGARGGMVSANVEGANLGELALDEYWAAAQELRAPVFIHPVAPNPLARTTRFALNQIVQYTFDTTLTLGSLISSGVLDRFPGLDLIVSHGGGALPYLIGRFDVMHARMDQGQQNVAAHPPSAYLRRFHYDTILHDAEALRYLAKRVGCERIVLGSDDPFPPMDRDPLATVSAVGFSVDEQRLITDGNARRLLGM
jgi:aminocarboxymuconate-semialdehyde decarboxylase